MWYQCKLWSTNLFDFVHFQFFYLDFCSRVLKKLIFCQECLKIFSFRFATKICDLLLIFPAMDFDDPRFFFRLRDALCDFQEKGRQHSRVLKDEFPIFFGEAHSEIICIGKWKSKRIFKLKGLDDDMSYKYAILRFRRGASICYEGFQSKRNRIGRRRSHHGKN